MQIVIFGASGQTGRLLVDEALAAGHQVTAYVRREGAFAGEKPGLTIITGTLEDENKLEQAIAGADVCVSTLGGNSLTKKTPELIEGIDRIIRIMEKCGVSRFIYMSSIGASESRYFMGPLIRLFIVGILLRVPLAHHTANEKRIMASNLDWTLLRPGGLTTGPKTGKYKLGTEFTKIASGATLARADVAAVILQLATSPEYRKKAVWML